MQGVVDAGTTLLLSMAFDNNVVRALISRHGHPPGTYPRADSAKSPRLLRSEILLSHFTGECLSRSRRAVLLDREEISDHLH
jgi:hypothetical protein